MPLNEFFFASQELQQPTQFYLATVGSVSASGTTLTFDGQTEPTTKRYKRLTAGTALAAGDRVLVLRTNGSFVILGKIGF